MRRQLALVAALALVVGAAAIGSVPTAGSAAPDRSGPRLKFVGSRIGDFALNQSAPGAVTEVRDPAGSGERVLKLTAHNDDVYPVTPTRDPRASLLTPTRIQPGDDFWWRAKFLLPRNFPSSVPGWLVVLEGPYGPPFDSTPPWHIEVTGRHIEWVRNGTYRWDVPWRMPLVRGRWIHVLMHCRFSEHGFVDMWIDGRRVTFFRGNTYNPNHHRPTRRLRMRTRDHSNDGGANFAVLMNYRKAGMFRTVTVYQGETELGATAAAVRR
jgi:Polysaccharide lyase